MHQLPVYLNFIQWLNAGPHNPTETQLFGKNVASWLLYLQLMKSDEIRSDKKVKHCTQLPCFFLSITSNLIISNRSVNTEPKPNQTNRPQNKTKKNLRLREKIWKIWMRSILLVLALYLCTLNWWSKCRIDVFIWEVAVACNQSCVSQR